MMSRLTSSGLERSRPNASLSLSRSLSLFRPRTFPFRARDKGVADKTTDVSKEDFFLVAHDSNGALVRLDSAMRILSPT
jgi:hypothetical protein